MLQPGMEQEVFRWITADTQLGKYDQVSPHFVMRAGTVLDNFVGIAADITNDQVQLSQSNSDRFSHCRKSLFFDELFKRS
jgi:hypothetical protein